MASAIFSCIFAVFVMGKGLLLGNIIGIGIVLLQHYAGIFRLDASIYYVDSVPVLFNFCYVLAINVATLVICVFSLIVPSFLVSPYPSGSGLFVLNKRTLWEWFVCVAFL